MNPRQRQGLLLVIIAAAGLLGVFLLIASYVSDVSKQVGPMTQVLVLRRALPAYQAVTAADLGFTSVPQKWAPANALRAPAEALNLIATSPLPVGTYLEQGVLTQPPLLQPGSEEIAIPVDAESGVGGQITQGSLVDIIATYGSGGRNGKAFAQYVVRHVRVLDVPTGAASGPLNLALTPQQALVVSLAESTASKVRLALVAPGSPTTPENVPPYSQGP
jgi:pilus assembly protein CpaB